MKRKNLKTNMFAGPTAHQASSPQTGSMNGSKTGPKQDFFSSRFVFGLLVKVSLNIVFLLCYWLYKKNYQPIGVTVRSHCAESLQRFRRGMDCSEM